MSVFRVMEDAHIFVICSSRHAFAPYYDASCGAFIYCGRDFLHFRVYLLNELPKSEKLKIPFDIKMRIFVYSNPLDRGA